MRQDKLDYYEDHLADLERQGIVYMPMIYTAYGRRHPSATKMLKHAATMVTRQRGQANAIGLLSHWHRQMAAEVWRRAARMIKACMPKWVPPHIKTTTTMKMRIMRAWPCGMQTFPSEHFIQAYAAGAC